MQCSRCKTENEDSAKFCATCGAPMHEVTAPPSIACPVCRHDNPPGANFCVACGTNLRQYAAAQARVAPIAPPTASKDAARPIEAAAAAATAAASHPSAEAANKPPLPPRPQAPDLDFMHTESPQMRPEKKSRFELAAGLAVLILFLGGGLFWWNNQKNARMAEMVLSAAAPATLAKATQETKPVPALPAIPGTSPQDTAAAPAVVESAAGKPAIPESLSERSRRTVKRKAAHRHVSQSAPAPIVEMSEAERKPAVAPASPAPVERRRPSGREQVSACRQLPLFEGEKCLWRICNGKWGKDGCPSYER